MFPFNLFKKKEIELDETSLPVQQVLYPSKEFNSRIDKEDLILSKLETINAKLDNIDQRLKKIEEIANS
mgnify:CR=1 FL=1